MWMLLGKLLGGLTGLADRIVPDRNRQNEAQSRINEAEVSGAPASRMRLSWFILIKAASSLATSGRLSCATITWSAA